MAIVWKGLILKGIDTFNLSPDDGWLDIGPEQLDSMLNKLMDKDGKMDGFDLEKVTDKMKSFVDKVSSHEGAEFPKLVQH